MTELAHELAQNWRTTGAAKGGSGPDCASLAPKGAIQTGAAAIRDRSEQPEAEIELAQNWRGIGAEGIAHQ